MSNTQKDKPYWVRAIQEGTRTQHRHPNGWRTWTEHQVRDFLFNEDGSPLIRQVPVYLSANMITCKFLYGYMYDAPEDVRRQARLLVSAGRGTEKLVVKVKDEHAWEWRVVHPGFPYCTEGMVPKSKYEYNLMDCTPRNPNQTSYVRDMSGKKKSFHREIEGRSRSKARSSLTKMKNAWNSGEDLTESEENLELEMTNQGRHSMAWMLW